MTHRFRATSTLLLPHTSHKTYSCLARRMFVCVMILSDGMSSLRTLEIQLIPILAILAVSLAWSLYLVAKRGANIKHLSHFTMLDQTHGEEGLLPAFDFFGVDGGVVGEMLSSPPTVS